MLDGERLDIFLRRVGEVRSTRLIRTGALSDAFHIGATRSQPAVLSVSQPDEDDFRSFLLCFRHFVAEREPATLDKVANVLLQNMEADRLRKLVVESRSVWRSERQHGAMRLVIDGRDYGPERVLGLYLNGQYFHSDEAKARDLDSLGLVGGRLSRQQLNAMLVSGVNHASALEWAILTGRREGLFEC